MVIVAYDRFVFEDAPTGVRPSLPVFLFSTYKSAFGVVIFVARFAFCSCIPGMQLHGHADRFTQSSDRPAHVKRCKR